MTDSGRIDKVRVFVDRATVTRVRTVALAPGVQTVVFAKLPPALETDTLRAKARVGDRNLSVVGVGATASYAEPSSKRRAEVEASLDEVRRQLQAADDALSSEAHAASMLGKYAALASDHLAVEWLDGDPDFGRWNKTLDALREGQAQRAAERAAGAAEIEALHERRAELEAELSRLGVKSFIGHDVTVTLEIPDEADGDVAVELAYVTKAAQWMPAYDARLEEDGEAPRVRWSAVAMVKQTTGEDWSDVELVATTARPPLSEPPPELHKLLLTGHAGGADKEVKVSTDAGARLTGGGGGGGSGGGAAPAPAAQVEHTAPGRVAVPSTGRPVRVELFEGDMPVEKRLEVAARRRPVATWVLQLENQTGRVLLPGPVSLYRGPNYSGRTDVGFVAGAERFSLPLATEGGLRIDRSSTAKPPRRSTMTGTQTFEYETKTKIENTSKAPIEIWIRDRIPKSRSEKIKVEVTEMPRNVDVEPDTGRFEHRLRIEAKSEATLQVGYRILAPRGFDMQPPELL